MWDVRILSALHIQFSILTDYRVGNQGWFCVRRVERHPLICIHRTDRTKFCSRPRDHRWRRSHRGGPRDRSSNPRQYHCPRNRVDEERDRHDDGRMSEAPCTVVWSLYSGLVMFVGHEHLVYNREEVAASASPSSQRPPLPLDPLHRSLELPIKPVRRKTRVADVFFLSVYEQDLNYLYVAILKSEFRILKLVLRFLIGDLKHLRSPIHWSVLLIRDMMVNRNCFQSIQVEMMGVTLSSITCGFFRDNTQP